MIVIRTGAGAAADRLELFVAGLEDWSVRPPDGGRNFWESARDVWHWSRLQMYATMNASEGDMWPDYDATAEKDRYVAVKAAILGVSQEAVRRTVLRWPGVDRLFGGLTSPSHPDAIFLSSATRGEYATATPWAGANDRGEGLAPEWLGGHPIPRRPLTQVGPATMTRFEETALRYVSSRALAATDRMTGDAALAARRRR